MIRGGAISSMISDAQRFREHIESQMASLKRQQGALGNFMVRAVVPRGARGLVSKIGKDIAGGTKAKKLAELYVFVTRFIIVCQERVKLLSINNRGLTLKGNSPVLVRKFNAALRIRDPLKAIEKTLVVVQEINSLDLIWNAEIPQELERRREVKRKDMEEKRAALMARKKADRMELAAGSIDRDELGAKLEKYPAVRVSMLGAFDALYNGGPDGERHCVLSCRTGLENLCIAIGGEKDWKAGLKKIMPSETDQRAIIGVWNYLSGKGAHGGHIPTREETELGLKMTIALIEMILLNDKKDHTTRLMER